MPGQRITEDMTALEAVDVLAAGNHGVTCICLDILQRTPQVDPDNVMGGFGVLLNLEAAGVWGLRIRRLYDICGQDTGAVIAVMRALQLGVGGITRETLSRAIVNHSDSLDIDTVARAIQRRLPNFDLAAV